MRSAGGEDRLGAAAGFGGAGREGGDLPSAEGAAAAREDRLCSAPGISGGGGQGRDAPSAEGPAAPGGPAAADLAAVARQLGRPPRGMRSVAHRCPCGLPDVVETAPRLPDGTPFPTLYYLTCVRARAAASKLEASGVMRQLADRLAADPGLRASYARAHRDYAARRAAAAAAAGVRPLPPDAATAGGMPDRVKCLHALAAHELAAPGANPLGREAILAMGEWWQSGPCVEPPGS